MSAGVQARWFSSETRSRDAYAGIVCLWLVLVLFVNDLVTQLLGHGWAGTLFGAQKDLLLLALIALAVKGRSARPDPRLLAAVCLVFAASAVSLVHSSNLIAAAYGLRNDYLGLLLLLVGSVLLTEPSGARLVTLVVGLSQAAAALALCTWVAGLPWLQWVVGRDASGNFPATFFVAGDQHPRAFSPFVSPNSLGLVMAIACAATLVWWPRLGRIPPWLLLVLPTAALCASQSRSAFMGLASGCGLIAVLAARLPRANHSANRTQRSAAAVLLLLMLGLISMRFFGFSPSDVLPDPATETVSSPAASHSRAPTPTVERNSGSAPSTPSGERSSGGVVDPSTQGHIDSTLDSLRRLSTAPLGLGLGDVGPRSVRHSGDPYLTEGSFFLVGLEIGWLGLAAFVTVLYLTVRVARDATGQSGMLANGVLIAVILPSLLLLPTLQEVGVAWLWWLLAAVGLTWTSPHDAPVER